MITERKKTVWPALYMLGYFLAVGLLAWRLGGNIGSFVFFVLIGIFTGTGFLIHALSRPGRRALGRRLSLALVSLSLFLGAGIFGRQSFQIEGFFFYALAGVFGGVVVHYLVAKILGPLLVGRGWCGWGCWIWMVFDLLPFHKSPGRKAGWGWMRPLHFALSLGLVTALVFVFKYDHGFEWKQTHGVAWFLGGSAFYYSLGILLAFLMKDNRAFCKYACPITVFLRAGNRLSLLKVKGEKETCTQCKSCEKACPMDIQVASFVAKGIRVLDPECTLCQTCLASCPQDNLRLSLGFDVSGRKNTD
jgi:ferredoxin-type protein NapH